MITVLTLLSALSPAFAGELQSSVAELESAHPEVVQQVSTARLVPNRNGTFRLVGADPDPALALAHLGRALDASLPEAERLAHARFAGATTEDVELVRQVVGWSEGDRVRRAFVAGLLHNDLDLAAPLVELARSGDAVDRRLAVTALVRSPARTTFVDVLVQRVLDEDRDVRHEAVRGLGLVEAPVADVLVARLTDADPKVRLAALRSLERQDPTRALQAAPELLQDPSPPVQRAADRLMQAPLGPR